MSKTRPILFSGPMVRAVLDGRKTQTRRICKLDYRPGMSAPEYESFLKNCLYGQVGDALWVRETFVIETQVEGDQKPPHDDGRPIMCTDEDQQWHQAHYRATDPAPELSYQDCEEPHCRWKPSIFMPKWASRITLKITDVRVERLNEISDKDCQAEGVQSMADLYHHIEGLHKGDKPVDTFKSLIDSINGDGTFACNPWVWVLEFKR